MMNSEIVVDKAGISEKDKVIIGNDGWLFLGNDTNNSISQYEGEIFLRLSEIEGYKNYFEKLKEKISCDFFFSIAPNKEYVLPEKYPFIRRKKGNILIYEQVIALLDEYGIDYHYPTNELASVPRSYYKTDTHWSEYGAYTTLSNYLSSQKKIDLITLTDEDFKLENVSGDLGSKLDGRTDGRLNYNFNVDSYEVFRSGLKNHGYACHYANPNAKYAKKVLVFGDSFGQSYIKPLVLTFNEVVFLYSPATFIENVYDAFSPDIVIFEINQRFLLSPPDYRSCMAKSSVFKKFKTFSLEEVKHFISEKTKIDKSSFLKDLYIRELEDFIPTVKQNDLTDHNSKIIFDGNEVKIKANLNFHDRINIVVTFSARADKPHESGFGETFFQKNKIPAIHFISKANHWWQTSEMQSAIKKVIPLLADYKNIYTYGASMGGHGALIFSKALGATHIIAGSPQYAIKGRLTPWAQAWERDTQNVNELFTIEDGLAKTAKVYCIFDPYNDFDLKHVNQINKLVPIVRIKTAFSGHSAILQLKSQGLLSRLLKTIIMNTEPLNEVIKHIRLKRSDTLSYLNGLGKRASSHPCRKKVAAWAKTRAIHLAKEILFGNSQEEFLHSDIASIFKPHCAYLVKKNKVREALSIAENYVKKYPNVVFSHDLLSYIYWKMKEYDKALLESKRALRLNKQDTSYRISVIRLCLASGQTNDLQYHIDVILNRPFKNKNSWIALYKDMNTFGAPPDLRLKITQRIKEVDPNFSRKPLKN